MGTLVTVVVKRPPMAAALIQEVSLGITGVIVIVVSVTTVAE